MESRRNPYTYNGLRRISGIRRGPNFVPGAGKIGGISKNRPFRNPVEGRFRGFFLIVLRFYCGLDRASKPRTRVFFQLRVASGCFAHRAPPVLKWSGCHRGSAAWPAMADVWSPPAASDSDTPPRLRCIRASSRLVQFLRDPLNDCAVKNDRLRLIA